MVLLECLLSFVILLLIIALVEETCVTAVVGTIVELFGLAVVVLDSGGGTVLIGSTVVFGRTVVVFGCTVVEVGITVVLGGTVVVGGRGVKSATTKASTR